MTKKCVKRAKRGRNRNKTPTFRTHGPYTTDRSISITKIFACDTKSSYNTATRHPLMQTFHPCRRDRHRAGDLTKIALKTGGVQFVILHGTNNPSRFCRKKFNLSLVLVPTDLYRY